MAAERWQVRFTRSALADLPAGAAWVVDRSLRGSDWIRQAGLVEGMPFLISPVYDFDVLLNGYFYGASMLGAAVKTREAHARDLAGFLSFLWVARGGVGWREATEADHLAYLWWRRNDVDGPHVAAATWDREVATVNQFYRWAVKLGHVAVNPIPQVRRRSGPVEAGWSGRRTSDESRPATYSHSASRDKVQWLPAAEYRMWRDVGIRGFRADGQPNDRFRGRWAARNAAFADLMVRTGLRLSEQAGLSVFDIPRETAASGYRRFWLPEALAKGRSARWVYVPSGVVQDLAGYADIDRRYVIAEAQAVGRYDRWRNPLVVDAGGQVIITASGGSGRRMKVADLGFEDRARLLVEGPSGLEPAAFWLGERGEPLTVELWKMMFRKANERCSAAGVQVRCHAHQLRHTFAVVTLEQLQRGHVAALGDLNADQRGHYTRVFGDPLDWVRRRLGHRSVVTTQIYLHALAELEMHTRMQLVPDGWDSPPEVGLAAGSSEQ